MEYRDFINTNMNDVITALNGSITPAPVNSELYRDFLNRKADDVITALNGSITPAPAGDELYRDFIERKFDDVIAGIGGYVPPVTFPTLTGSIVTFNAQYALPLKSHTVDIDSVSGVSAINIMATGKNLAPINAHTQTASGTTITVDDNGIATVSGTGTGSHFFEYYRGNFNFPKGTYRLTAWVNGEEYTQSSSATSPYRIYFSMTNGGQVNADNSFTVNQDTGLWIIYIQTRNGFTYDNDEVKIQIELGTVPTEWQKFGKLINIPIGQTVKEATYNARTGVMEVTQPSVHTLQLPPCPIDTLEGVNNIFADTGETTLQYIKIGGNT